jgi:hypothetical protein
MPNIWTLLKNAVPDQQLWKALWREGKIVNNNQFPKMVKCPWPVGWDLRVTWHVWANAPDTDALGKRVQRVLWEVIKEHIGAGSKVKYVLKQPQLFMRSRSRSVILEFNSFLSHFAFQSMSFFRIQSSTRANYVFYTF